jgi:hypothetical protein
MLVALGAGVLMPCYLISLAAQLKANTLVAALNSYLIYIVIIFMLGVAWGIARSIAPPADPQSAVYWILGPISGAVFSFITAGGGYWLYKLIVQIRSVGLNYCEPMLAGAQSN